MLHLLEAGSSFFGVISVPRGLLFIPVNEKARSYLAITVPMPYTESLISSDSID